MDEVALNQKIQKLEARVKELEAQVAQDEVEHQYMDALFELVKKIAAQNPNPSVILLQKKLLIDHQRATQLLARLNN